LEEIRWHLGLSPDRPAELHAFAHDDWYEEEPFPLFTNLSAATRLTVST